MKRSSRCDRWATSIARVAAACCVTALPLFCANCGFNLQAELPNEDITPIDTDRFEQAARFVQISDTHIIDEESPARLTATAGLTGSAWRPQEAYSTQLLDGTIRAVNKLHVARGSIDFLIHTGDATDNAQLNELEWFVGVVDGGMIDPLSGVDDRDPEDVPAPLLDPHRPFEAQGLYRNGVHGEDPTIKWFALMGNHDRFALGVFPIVTDFLGGRSSPLPLRERFGLFLPLFLDPVGSLSWGPVTPAFPGPPQGINLPQSIPANPDRRYMNNEQFVRALIESGGEPSGHGFDTENLDFTWYSVSPVPGVRLIALNSATPLFETPALTYHNGAISLPQRLFLEAELAAAQQRDECVIVATHHPSAALALSYGTSLTESSMVRLLNDYDCVKVHVAGHWHRNVVFDRGGYLEIVTGSIIDAPQQGRVIEIWRGGAETELRYWMFSHTLPTN